MPIMNWSKLFKRERKRKHYTDIDFGLGLESFREDPSNVGAMQDLLASPLGKKILSVLHFHRPRGYPVRGKASIEDAALEHMRREGHEGAIDLLIAMGANASETEEPKATWGVEEEE